MRVQHKLSRISARTPRGALGLAALAFFALFFVTGCPLVSATLRIEHNFEEGPQQSTGQNVKELAVDLNADSNYKDNKDKIKSVDEVGFVFRAQNNLGNTAHGVIYISRTPIRPLTFAGITGSPLATPVVKGLVLQPGYTDITYDESLALEMNQKVLHDIVKDGTFYLYGIADQSEFDITIDKLTAVVVVTAEL
jgi:hypothetical protein